MEVDLENENLYEILGLDSTCSMDDVKKAYRKKSRQCHPDKHPDNPDAARQFQKLGKVLEILTDEIAREEYDRVHKRKQEDPGLQTKQLDSTSKE